MQQSVLSPVSVQLPALPPLLPAAYGSGKLCPQCGRQNVQVANFCTNCGHRLQQQQLLLSPALLSPSTLTPLHWRTTHTFSGNGSQKTATFCVSDHWRIVWSCDPAAVERVGYVVVVKMDGPDGSSGDGGVKAVCEQNATSRVDEISSGGQLCLHIISGGEWTVRVQERE